jgi:hypothetical protein
MAGARAVVRSGSGEELWLAVEVPLLRCCCCRKTMFCCAAAAAAAEDWSSSSGADDDGEAVCAGAAAAAVSLLLFSPDGRTYTPLLVLVLPAAKLLLLSTRLRLRPVV